MIFFKSKHILGFLRLWQKIMSWSNSTSNHLKIISTLALTEIFDFSCTGTSRLAIHCRWTKKFNWLYSTFKSNLNRVLLKYFAHQMLLQQRSNHQWKIYKCSSPLGKPFSNLESKLRLLSSCFKVTLNYKVRFNSPSWLCKFWFQRFKRCSLMIFFSCLIWF